MVTDRTRHGTCKLELTAAIFNDAIFDTAPLFATISRILDEAMLADIAREYGRGGCCWSAPPTSTPAAR
jgi:hypothetical protein